MTTPSNEQSLEGLIERVNAATGSNILLSNDIWRAVRGQKPRSILYHETPDVTASIDAALALVERLLPGWNYTLNRGHCELRHPKQRGKDTQAFGKTAPLAILAALLQALKDASE